MHFLDFLNSSPNNYIFQKTYNKTNFGGVSFLISVLGILAVGVYYIIIYCNKDKYSIEYSNYMYDFTREEYNLTQNIEFGYEIYTRGIYSGNGIIVLKNFSLIETETNNTVPRQEWLFKDIKKFDYLLVYECQDEECEIKENIPYNRLYIEFVLKMNYFNLQEDNPVNQTRISDSLPIVLNNFCEYIYYFEETICTTHELFGDKNDSIITPKKYNYFNSQLNYTIEKENKKYKALGRILFSLKTINWEHYKRTSKSFLDTISNICSLSMTILNSVRTIFLFLYSKNFDNYKIIQSLLINRDIKPKNGKNISKEMKSLSSSDFLLNSQGNYDNNNDDNKDEPNIVDEKPKISNEEAKDESDLKFPKLSFISFIFNTIYCRNCCNMKNQKLINKCSDIISKYYSIENIIKNQIQLENLLKDYNWNDSKLKNIESNELIKNLKNFIRNNYFSSNG